MPVVSRDRDKAQFGGDSNDRSNRVSKSKPRNPVTTPRKTTQNSLQLLVDAIATQTLISPATLQKGRDKTEQSEHDSDTVHFNLINSDVSQVGYQPSSEDEIIAAARLLVQIANSRVPTENKDDDEIMRGVRASTEMADSDSWVPTEKRNDDDDYKTDKG